MRGLARTSRKYMGLHIYTADDAHHKYKYIRLLMTLKERGFAHSWSLSREDGPGFEPKESWFESLSVQDELGPVKGPEE